MHLWPLKYLIINWQTCFPEFCEQIQKINQTQGAHCGNPNIELVIHSIGKTSWGWWMASEVCVCVCACACVCVCACVLRAFFLFNLWGQMLTPGRPFRIEMN
jgi:hypothetical protein